MSELPYSYHTFLFPFLWNDDGKIQWEEFKRVLSIGRRWRETSWKREQIPDGVCQEEWLQDFAAFQYFTGPANNVIFNTRGDNVVRCFEYLYNGTSLKNHGKYVISKGDKTYRLDINNIRLHVYDIGVAILILELENKNYAELDAVDEINEYGRRINMPFLSVDESHPVCADKIEITMDEMPFGTENYLETLQELALDFSNRSKHFSLNYIMKPIQKLLDGNGVDNGGYMVTSNTEHAGLKNMFIKPCVDDRMFVCCLVRDETFSISIKSYDVKMREYSYLSDCDKHDESGEVVQKTISNELYKLCFIEKDVTCQSTSMKREILKKSVYDRWIDWGTIHAVTHHSFICVTGKWEGLDKTVIFPFLTQYVQILILALAQRSAILLLSNEASTVAEGFKDNENITSEQIGQIEQLQAKYVKVQNQLLLSEITVQEQGVEIYNCIREQLYIGTNKHGLDEQLNNLRDVTYIRNERLEREKDKIQEDNDRKINLKINIFAIVIALLAVIEPLSAVIKNYWFFKNYSVDCIWVALDFLVLLICLIYLIWWSIKRHRSKKR
ncbi:MAG: hypothetical protein LBI03_04785 [Clostridiales bacterium]|jgi:hypothetical protein|nr:hypothetical protein [Clostridiales bacterium]